MVAALALVGCTKTELVDTPKPDSNSVSFDTYVGRDAQTRATIVDLDVVKLKGFGVNAYYNAEFNVSEDSTTTELIYQDVFMHNTKVTFSDEANLWTYSPIKYWPNNEGDHITFFAYAPYDKSNPGLGEGNADMSKIYDFTIAERVEDQIDLVYHKAFGEDGIAGTGDNGETYQMKKQKIQDKVRFNFQHALSRITFDVKAVVDDINDESDNLLDGNTHINIKKVALIGVESQAEEDGEHVLTQAPFYRTATLDMTTGEWIYNEDAGYQEYYMTGEDFYRPVEITTKYGDEWNTWYETEYVAQLNKFNPSQRLLADDHYLMILPQEFQEGNGYRIYIEYDVISEIVNNNGMNDNTTEDSSTITNRIYSDEMIAPFEQGKAYKFTLWLGMTSVKIDATETEWAEEDNEYVWLPENSAFDIDAQGNLLIQSAEDLAMFRSLINGSEWYVTEDGEERMYAEASYLQTVDIDLSSVLGPDNYWQPIGVGYGDTADEFPATFMGTYDGAGHTISNLMIHNEFGGSYQGGLFYKTYGATIKNVFVEGEILDAWGMSVGGVVGYAEGTTTIENCHFSGEIEIGSISDDQVGDDYNATNYVGGVVGAATEQAEIIACSNNATIYVNAGEYLSIGGVIGYANNANIVGCYNTGYIEVNSDYNNVGGIAGNVYGGTITSCYNSGELFISTEENNTVGSILGNGSAVPSYSYYTSDYPAVKGSDDSSFTYVNQVSEYDLVSSEWDEESGDYVYTSAVAPWLNYGLNGNGTTAGYEYYVNSDNERLCIQEGTDAGTTPPVLVWQWVESELTHNNNKIEIPDAYTLAVVRDYINAGTKFYIEPDNSKVFKYAQIPVSGGNDADAAKGKLFADADYVQTGSIDFEDLWGTKYDADAYDWTPIGTGSYYFTGSYDGGSKSIYHLTFGEETQSDKVGLFYIVEGAEISNVIVESYSFSEFMFCGAVSIIAGRAIESTFTNCQAGVKRYDNREMNFLYDANWVGAIAASSTNSTFTNCVNYVGFGSGHNAAMVCGISNGDESTKFVNCRNYGNMESTENGHAAGISASGFATITNCHNYGDIMAEYAAGIAGLINPGDDPVTIVASHNEGLIKGDYCSAGICAMPYQSLTLRGCYNVGFVSPATMSAGLIAYPIAGKADAEKTFTMIGCYSALVYCNAAFVDFAVDADDTYTNLVFSECYYSDYSEQKQAVATAQWDKKVTGATKFTDDQYVWWITDDSDLEAGTSAKEVVMDKMNAVLTESTDVLYAPNGDDSSAEAVHPLIHANN